MNLVKCAIIAAALAVSPTVIGLFVSPLVGNGSIVAAARAASDLNDAIYNLNNPEISDDAELMAFADRQWAKEVGRYSTVMLGLSEMQRRIYNHPLFLLPKVAD